VSPISQRVPINVVGTPGGSGPAGGQDATAEVGTAPVSPDCRTWLARIGDVLIPASGDMPAASAAGVGGHQLDVVLKARPDLGHHLTRAWVATAGDDAATAIDSLRELDPTAYDAVRLAVAGGYYTNPDVRSALGYTGQQPRTVRIAEDIEEEVLMRVVERGPRFRPA
jgi:hypothetical protein